MKKKVLLIIVILSMLCITGCGKQSNKDECCECKDCPECDVCCSCDNPYLNK